MLALIVMTLSGTHFDPLALPSQNLQPAYTVLPEQSEELQIGVTTQAYKLIVNLLLGPGGIVIKDSTAQERRLARSATQ